MKGENMESAQKSRENESDRDVVGFLSSDWYAEQCEIYLLNIKFTKEKSLQPRIFSGTQLKKRLWKRENVK